MNKRFFIYEENKAHGRTTRLPSTMNQAEAIAFLDEKWESLTEKEKESFDAFYLFESIVDNSELAIWGEQDEVIKAFKIY